MFAVAEMMASLHEPSKYPNVYEMATLVILVVCPNPLTFDCPLMIQIIAQLVPSKVALSVRAF
jgi:hypothetical protein